MDFEAYMLRICTLLGFRGPIEDFRDAIQFYWDANISPEGAVAMMRRHLNIERVH